MKQTSRVKILIHIGESFFTTWALMEAGSLVPGNILTGTFFLLSFFFYLRLPSHLEKKSFIQTPLVKRTALVIGILFTILYMAVDAPNYIESLTNPLFRFFILAASFIGFTILFYKLLLLLFSYSGDKQLLNNLVHSTKETDRHSPVGKFPRLKDILRKFGHFYQKHAASCSFAICLFCWLPYFLYQYPGIIMTDSINQLKQVLGLAPYSNHHPVVQTLLLQIFYRLGSLFTSDMLIAISFYTVFQMCFMAFCIAHLIKTFRLFQVRSLLCFLITLFYALVPYNAIFAINLWKDTLFAGFVLLFGCTMLRLIRNCKPLDLILFILSGIMICLMRSNGWYGFLVSFPFLLYYYRKSAKIFFPSLAAIFLTAAVVKYPLMNAFHVIQPDLIESLSIPAQQIAAVISNDRELTSEQSDLIGHVVDLNYVKELYDPFLSDYMKELVRAGDQNYLVDHKKEFFSLYLKLGATYPGDYLKAYIDQTYGYWHPGAYHTTAEGEGISPNTLGLSTRHLIKGPIVVKIREIATKLGSMLPLYSLLWNMGTVFWFFVFCAGTVIIRGESKKLIYFLIGFTLYLTVMIATPVANEFRYMYFMMFSLPFYAMTAFMTLPAKEK